jgi:hypothetical protein
VKELTYRRWQLSLEFPRRPRLRDRGADFGPGSGTSGGTAVDDKSMFISFEKK